MTTLQPITRRARGETGVATVEYIGMTIVGAALVVAIAATPVGPALGDTVRYALCTALGEGCVAPDSPVSPYDRATSGQYVALGDSFSSGEGAGSYSPDSDRDENSTADRLGKFVDDYLIPGDHTEAKPTDFCHRSDNAYGPIIAGQNDFAGGAIFDACSGAVTQDFVTANKDNDGEGPQFDAITKDTTLVTFSIGGNDMGFGDVLQDCVVDGATCEEKNEAEFQRKLVSLKPVLILRYADAKKRASDDARIIVVGYPHLFPDEPSNSYRNLLFAQDQVWMNGKGDQLNEMIAAAAREAGVEFIDPTDAFNGHGIGSDDPWFNDISLGGPGWAPTDPGSLHPNAAGQAALAELVQEQLERP